MQFVEMHAVELSWNLQELQAQMHLYYWNKFFFQCLMMAMKYLWYHPPILDNVLLKHSWITRKTSLKKPCVMPTIAHYKFLDGF